ncbi:hypothetical protein CC1G_09627 [Coprinopsis cinerea okayama7|uniref:Uncharacterized protein n=1 Tax=Coprinopsis cinerea (strain Okayama-7 / 130 / ATCC MYA-4618 / FGSC 9003) TaxID=240176 RepID=A8N4E3_COPC7|nr:hypothetical protein CC1G_09627 [Coprinopsis cinerea okayama7\|eukprot:XP_001829738.1 hypothetical protein CC1G_09627 [Coprinopsis cinerea okayama7\
MAPNPIQEPQLRGIPDFYDERKTGPGPQSPEFLQLVLLAGESADKEDRYARIAFPASYKEAQESAARVFKRYSFHAADPENLVLRLPSKNRNGESVWADIDMNYWTRSALGAVEVGVFVVPRRSKWGLAYQELRQ